MQCAVRNFQQPLGCSEAPLLAPARCQALGRNSPGAFGLPLSYKCVGEAIINVLDPKSRREEVREGLRQA